MLRWANCPNIGRRSLDLFEIVLSKWPQELAKLGRIDLAERRNRLLDRVAARWREAPPGAISSVRRASPRRRRRSRGCCAWWRACRTEWWFFPGVDLSMPADEWDMLGPFDPDPATGRRKRALETHPQYPPEAADRPDGRAARRNRAMAGGDRAGCAARTQQGDRECDDAGRADQGMERTPGRRTAAG